MKSLDIVNLYLEEVELHECKEIMWLYRTSIQQIKQDLEVLEIIRKYLYTSNWNGFQSIEIDDLHSNKEDKKEEFNKVKQWLEENENDR